ncbi:MAG: hypothetical protein JNL81_02855 [Hyphomonadaceae bacterium]|nr:hypothetical protein [Hyphomonadaceae bacterium]
MFGRLAALALAVGLAGCAGVEPAGRNAQRTRPSPAATAPVTAPAPAPRASLPPPQTSAAPTPAPTPQVASPPPARQSAPVTTAPPPARQSAPVISSAPPPVAAPPVVAPPVAAPQVTAPPPSQPLRARSDRDDIVVPGQVETQVRPPNGDPRSNEERRADVRSWDQCITQVQGAFDSDPMSPQLTTPEEYCSQSLGMSDRTSVPIGRQQRRR